MMSLMPGFRRQVDGLLRSTLLRNNPEERSSHVSLTTLLGILRQAFTVTYITETRFSSVSTVDLAHSA